MVYMINNDILDREKTSFENRVGEAKVNKVSRIVEQYPYNTSEEMIKPMLEKIREVLPNIGVVCREYSSVNNDGTNYRFYLTLNVKPEDVIDENKEKRAEKLAEVAEWERQQIKVLADLVKSLQGNISEFESRVKSAKENLELVQ